jgi:hypothetical protein
MTVIEHAEQGNAIRDEADSVGDQVACGRASGALRDAGTR